MPKQKVLALGVIGVAAAIVAATSAAPADGQPSLAASTPAARAIATPGGLSPADGKALHQPQDPPTLSWSPVRGAASYVVEVDEGADADFVDVKQYETDANAIVVPDALPAAEQGTDYSWRVRAVNDNDAESRWSSDRSFKLVPLKQVVLTGPEDDAVVQDVVLDWEPLAGAAYYQLQVSTDDNFSDSTIVDAPTKVLGTRYSPSVTYDNNTYYWRVRAVDTSGNPSAWSDQTESGSHPRSFVRAWPDKPSLVWPHEGVTVGDPLYLQWTPVQHASQYELDMGTDENFSPNTFQTCILPGTTYTPGMFRINDVGGSTSRGTHEKCDPTPGVTMYWRVRGLDTPFYRSGTATDGLQGLFSATSTFTYHSGSAPFGTMSPANGAAVDVPELAWSPVTGAEYYKVTVKTNTGTSVVTNKQTWATSYVPVTSSPLTTAKSPYTWQITAYDAGDVPLTTSVQRSFSVTGSIPAAGSPLTAVTANNPSTQVDHIPLMAWGAYPGADHYRVVAGPGDATSETYFADDSHDVFGTDLPYPAVRDTWTHFQLAGQYHWHVVAYDSTNAPLATGPEASFRIGSVSAVDPTSVRMALDGTTIDAGNGFDAHLGCTQASCTDAPATPVISWNATPDATSYIVYVSEDPDFTNLVEKVTSLPATSNTRWAPTNAQDFPALAESIAGGSYYLFIRPCRSVNGQGTICGPRPVSVADVATNKFRKQSPPVQLTTPGDGATIRSTEVTLTWDDYRTTNAATTWTETDEAATQSAQWYRVQVDDNPNFSSPIETKTVDQPTYTAPAKLYPEGTLYWRVQAIDAADNDLAWSVTREFTKESPVVAPLTPAQGALLSGSTVFSWEPQAFAASYDVELYSGSAVSSSNRVFTENVKQAAYAWDRVIEPHSGAYVWRVRRVDAAGNDGPWSPIRSLSSGGSRTKVVSHSPGNHAQRTSDFVVKFSGRVTNVTSSTMLLKQAGHAAKIAAAVTLSSDGRTARLDPNKSLRRGERYTVALTGHITDRTGRAIKPFAWTVTVR